MTMNDSTKSDITISSRMKVKKLKDDFLNEFGLNIYVYKRYGRQLADDEITLAAIRNDEFKDAEFSIQINSKIINIQDKIMELFGFKVEICGSNGHLCNDDLTLAGAYEIDRQYVDGYEIVNQEDISDSHESHAQSEPDDDYQQEFEILHQNFSDALDNGIITFEEYDNAGAIMSALYPNETRLINIEEGNLDEDADLDDIGGIVMRDMLFDVVEDKAMFLKDYQKAINHCKNDNIDEVVAEIIEERYCDFEDADVEEKATSDENIDIHINGRMKVKTLKSQFAKEFGLTIRLYDGRSFADDQATLASIRKGDHKGGDLSPDRATKVGILEEKMLELFGLKIQIAGSDDSYLCDNDLSLAEAKEIDDKKIAKKMAKVDVNIAFIEPSEECMQDLFNEIVKIFKADPTNKVFVSEELLVMSVLEETGKQVNAVKLRKIINKFLAADMTDKDYEIYDGAVAVCGELARSCFGADPDEEIDYEIDWWDDDDGSFTAVIRQI